MSQLMLRRKFDVNLNSEMTGQQLLELFDQIPDSDMIYLFFEWVDLQSGREALLQDELRIRSGEDGR